MPNLHRTLIKENLGKNVLVLLISFFSYFPLTTALAEIEPAQINNFLLILSMLLVTVCFANFAFTYEKSKIQKGSLRFLSHAATFIFLVLTTLLLESIVVIAQLISPPPSHSYLILAIFSVLLYIGIVLYDFWDLLRVEE